MINRAPARHDHSPSSSLVVVGGSGFLGAAILDQSIGPARVVATHSAKPLQHSVPFDFWRNSPATLAFHSPHSIVFAADILWDFEARNRTVHEYLSRARGFIESFRSTRFLYVSSDAVFDGRNGRYNERDSPNPTSHYGELKLAFEQLLCEHHADYCIVRPSYIYGYSRGRLDHRLARARSVCRAGASMHLYTNMFRSPMAVDDVARVILKLLASRHVGPVHVGGPRMSTEGFFREGLRALGVSPEDSLVTSVLSEQAGIPLDTSLDCRLMKRLTGLNPLPVYQSLSKEKVVHRGSIDHALE